MKTTKFIHTCCLLFAALFLSGQALQAQTRMAQGANELLRINPQKTNQIDYSTNGGRTWMMRYTGNVGEFIDLLLYQNELIAITTKGVYYSNNNGRTWMVRYSGTSCGKFHSLTANGKELLAQTDKGLYYSTNSGRTWLKR